jgi:hypothetical protein
VYRARRLRDETSGLVFVAGAFLAGAFSLAFIAIHGLELCVGNRFADGWTLARILHITKLAVVVGSAAIRENKSRDRRTLVAIKESSIKKSMKKEMQTSKLSGKITTRPGQG